MIISISVSLSLSLSQVQHLHPTCLCLQTRCFLPNGLQPHPPPPPPNIGNIHLDVFLGFTLFFLCYCSLLKVLSISALLLSCLRDDVNTSSLTTFL
uniref:Uncharacterized protein n=1 Tax=Octopus bimaculoides TaxID=37653 RepID=A0A0L8HIT8_OCTBM